MSLRDQRFAILDGKYRKDINANNTKDIAKYLDLTNIYFMRNSSNSTLGVEVSFDWYEFEMNLFIFTLIINLVYVLQKILTRLRIFINEMAEFMDLLTAITNKLVAFFSYTLLWVLIFGWIFHALGQYQINVDSWYDINGIYDGVYFSGDTNLTKQVEM
jgi:hypothetical protein